MHSPEGVLVTETARLTHGGAVHKRHRGPNVLSLAKLPSLRGVMNKIAFVLLASLGLTGCATRTQTVGTTAGAVGGALVGGPVGAVVGGATGAVVAAPWGPFGRPYYRHYRCYYHDRYGRTHYRWC